MGGEDSMEFSNLSDSQGFSESASLSNNKKDGKGVYINPAVIVIYVLITVCLAVAVGLIVHFAHPGSTCRCDCQGIVTQGPTTPAPTTDPGVTPPDVTTPPATRPPEPEVVRGLRLPDNLVPTHYDIEIKPDIYGADPADFSYEGWVDIHLTCVTSTKLVVVQYRDMVIRNVTVQTSDDDPLTVEGTAEDPDREFFNITLEDELQTSDEIVVKLHYSGELKEDYAGMFWNLYIDNGNEERYAVLTQLQSTDSRKTFPCLDEPALKATFSMKLWRKDPMVALFNTPQIDETPDGEWSIVEFERTPERMSPYLVAFAVADFEFVEDSLSPTKDMKYYAPHDDVDNGNVDYVASIDGPMFDWFETLFRFNYTFQKLDSILINEFTSGAMENWGLVTYRGQRYLWDELFSTAYEKQRLAGTNAHELLHMWLGNVVTCDWWDNIWLQETMARYYQHIAIAEEESSWDVDQAYAAQVMYRALDTDATGRAIPICSVDHVVETPSEISSRFSSITYDKGSNVVRMIHKWVMGDDVFDDAMANFIVEHQYDSADHDALLKEWDDAIIASGRPSQELPSDRTMSDIMYTWIMQTGYPILTITRGTGGEFTVTQDIFLLDPQSDSPECVRGYECKWDVPVTYVTEDDPDVENDMKFDWLLHDQGDLTISTTLADTEWLLANVRQFGFYRVNYDDNNWNLLTQQLDDDHEVFDPLNRAALIDDSMHLVRAEKLDMMVALDTLPYLSGEDEYIPWYVADRTVNYIATMLRASAGYGKLSKFMRELAKPNYDNLGWDLVPADQLTKNYLQELTIDVACTYADDYCLQESAQLFQNWREDPTNWTTISPEFRQTVYCSQIRYGMSDSWDFLFEQYQNNTHSGPDGNERLRMRNALSCSSQRWILERYFAMAAENDERIFFKDRTSIMTGVARTTLGSSVAWDYLNIHWDEDYMRSVRMSVLEATVQQYSTELELEKLRNFISANEAESASDYDRFESMKNTVQANINWRKRNEQDLMNWLDNRLE